MGHARFRLIPGDQVPRRYVEAELLLSRNGGNLA